MINKALANKRDRSNVTVVHYALSLAQKEHVAMVIMVKVCLPQHDSRHW